jgi:phage/plasmid-associated DNA primase
MVATSSDFIKVSKTNPCPLCGKPDWCKTSPDNEVVMCPRTDITPPGWKRIKDTVDGHGIYKLETEDNFEAQVSGRRPTKKVSKAKVLPVPAVPIGLKLAKIENAAAPKRQPISDTLWSIVKKQILKETPGTSRETVWEIAYSYGDDKTVYRAEWADITSAKGYRKTYRQSHVDDGLIKWEKGKAVWKAYRVDEVLGILGDAPINEPVVPLMVEGEPNVETARSHSIASITLQGSNWSEEQIKAVVKELQEVNCRALPYLYDNDEIGRAKADKIKSACDLLQFPCILIDPKAIFPDIPDKGDIKEILENMDADEFIRRIEEELHLRAKTDKEHETNLLIGDQGEEEETPPKPPSPQATASRIAEQYRHQWKFDNEQKTWRIWTSKEWEKIEIGNFESLLMTVIEAKNIYYGSDNYLSNVLKILTKKLRVATWQTWDRKRYISFSNYVLDTDKGKGIEHSPGMGFTSHLPFEYKPLKRKVTDGLKALQENCPNIYSWMNTAMQGDRRKIFKLLAIINGLLKFRFFDLQMFVHLVGKPGSGKGTFIRLLQKIVGRENWKGCKLKHLDDGSTMASVIDKQLVSCPDERNALGVDAILSLTGGDAISYREVYRPAADAFFYGLLIVGSNNPIFVGDTTGLDRRLCLIHFDNPLPTARRDSKIEGEMDAEISQLIAIALDIPDSEVTKNIQGIGKNQIAEFKLQEWEMKLQTNSVAAHFDDCLIVDPTASTTTGKLYEHYKNWCDSNLKPVSHIKYPKMLSELCNDYLELGSVKWKRSGGRSWFEGLRLRSEGETLPTHSDSLSALIPTDTGFDGVCTGFVRGLETLPDGNYSDLRDLEGENILENLSLDSEPQDKALNKVQEVGEKSEKVSLNPVNSVEAPKPLLLADLNPVANPVTTPSEPRQTPSSEMATAQEFAEQIRKAIANIDRSLAIKIWNALAGKAKAELMDEVTNCLAPSEAQNFKLLAKAGFLLGTRVKYVGDPKYAEQYEGLELKVYSMNEYAQINCRKPDDCLTTWLKPEELEKL